MRVMREALRAKFEQHSVAREALLATGCRPIVEASPTDAFWGSGHGSNGGNKLGRLLMELRDELAKREAPVSAHVDYHCD